MKQKEKKEEGVEFISALMEIVPIPIFYKNKEGVYLGCNKSFEDFLGKKKEEIAGKTVFELSPGKWPKFITRPTKNFWNPEEPKSMKPKLSTPMGKTIRWFSKKLFLSIKTEKKKELLDPLWI
jgi:PAS domain S-box-containing protein